MKLILERYSDDGIQTNGVLYVMNDNTIVHSLDTIELPYLGNKNNISCIPVGTYQVIKRYSDKYKQHFHILNVPNRTYILIHSANFFYQLKGCIAVGKDLSYIDSDEQIDLTKSKQALKELLEIMPDSFEITIS